MPRLPFVECRIGPERVISVGLWKTGSGVCVLADRHFRELQLNLCGLPTREVNARLQLAGDIDVFVLRTVLCPVQLGSFTQTIEIFISREALLYQMLVIGNSAIQKFATRHIVSDLEITVSNLFLRKKKKKKTGSTSSI